MKTEVGRGKKTRRRFRTRRKVFIAVGIKGAVFRYVARTREKD